MINFAGRDVFAADVSVKIQSLHRSVHARRWYVAATLALAR